MSELTLAMIKPDAVANGEVGRIISILEMNRFKIVGMKMLKMDELDAAAFYSEHRGKDFFKNLVEFTSSGPVVALILEKENAIADYRTLMKETLRPRFASTTNPTSNAVHGSDSKDAATREIGFLWHHTFN